MSLAGMRISALALLAALGSHGFMGAKAEAYQRSSDAFREPKPTGRIRRAGPVRGRLPAPYLQAAPIIDGVRMRWEKGRLVPRVQS